MTVENFRQLLYVPMHVFSHRLVQKRMLDWLNKMIFTPNKFYKNLIDKLSLSIDFTQKWPHETCLLFRLQ